MRNMTKEFQKKKAAIIGIFAIIFLAAFVTGCTKKQADTESVPDTSPQVETSMDESGDNAEVAIEVPTDDESDNMVALSVEDTGRSDPFVPSSERVAEATPIGTNIPQEKLKYDVLAPLETDATDEAAKKVVTTKVSGIMYDKNSPSAILNFDGSDYLVRSGDVINGFKVLSIGSSAVTVQYGHNVYRAGVGQPVTSGEGELNYNTVANLSNKFGGAKR